jgi:hypothetical protein
MAIEIDTRNELKKGGFRVKNEVPQWRILLAWPFMKIGIGILGGENVTLERPVPNDAE